MSLNLSLFCKSATTRQKNILYSCIFMDSGLLIKTRARTKPITFKIWHHKQKQCKLIQVLQERLTMGLNRGSAMETLHIQRNKYYVSNLFMVVISAYNYSHLSGCLVLELYITTRHFTVITTSALPYILCHNLQSFSGLSKNVKHCCCNVRWRKTSFCQLICRRSVVNVSIRKYYRPPLQKKFEVIQLE